MKDSRRGRDDQAMISMLSAYTASLKKTGSPIKKAGTSPAVNENSTMKRMVEDKEQLLAENVFLKRRMESELHEKQLLNVRHKELNRKFEESKKALQATGAALMQVRPFSPSIPAN
jgi:hypothetical protein